MHSEEARIYFTILLTAAIIGIILVFFIITIIRQQRKKSNSLEERVHAEIRLLETERERIASDLHDELGPLLSTIKLNMQFLDTNNENDARVIAKTEKYIDETMVKVRQISNNVMPYTLQKKGLLAAIEEFVMILNENKSFKVRCQFDGVPDSLDKEKEINIYRVVQEITNNSIKHSKASLIHIKLHTAGKNLEVTVSDNGVGFNSEEISRKSAGLGLRNIIRRTDMLKGYIYLDTSPGKGTHYLIKVPF